MKRGKAITARGSEELASLVGLKASHAREWDVQVALYSKLKEVVANSKLTHQEVADKAETSRTRITAVLNGDLTHVSTDLLIRILGALGYRTTVTFRKIAA